MRTTGVTLTALALVTPAWLGADSGRPPRIRQVEGEVTLQRASEAEAEPADPNTPWLGGDRLWTGAGRVELQLADGSLLHVAADSKLDLASLGSADGREPLTVQLWAGSLRLAVVDSGYAPALALETPDARVLLREPGLYRIDAIAGETRVSVWRGTAELEAGGERLALAAGQRSYARYGDVPEPADWFDPREGDAFDAWSEARPLRRAAGAPADLPPEIEPWGAELGDYGSWVAVPEVGTAWRPQVALDWEPYRYGRWVWTPWGWSWVGDEPWGWAPYRYGRWGHSHSIGWYWVPGRHWGPAWVSWSIGGGYVGWCPLGVRGRPVYAWGGGHHGRGWNFAHHSGLGSRGPGHQRVSHDRVRGVRLSPLDDLLQPDRHGRYAVARDAAPRTAPTRALSPSHARDPRPARPSAGSQQRDAAAGASELRSERALRTGRTGAIQRGDRREGVERGREPSSDAGRARPRAEPVRPSAGRGEQRSTVRSGPARGDERDAEPAGSRSQARPADRPRPGPQRATEQARPRPQQRPAESTRPRSQARPSERARPRSQPRPAEQQRPRSQPRPAESARPRAQSRPAERERPRSQARPAEQQRPRSQARPAERERPRSQPRPAERERPRSQARPAQQDRPHSEARPAAQQRPGRQARPTEQARPPSPPRPGREQGGSVAPAREPEPEASGVRGARPRTRERQQP